MCYLVVILVDVLVELMKSNKAVHLRGEALQTHRLLNRQHKLKRRVVHTGKLQLMF